MIPTNLRRFLCPRPIFDLPFQQEFAVEGSGCLLWMLSYLPIYDQHPERSRRIKMLVVDVELSSHLR